MNRTRAASASFILVTLFLDTLGIGLIIPVLPRLLESMVGGNLAAASRYTGIFMAVYSAMQFLFAPILGGLSDRYGRRAVILTSLLGATLDYVLLAFAPTLSWLFVGRAIAGLTSASFATATAYIADVTPPEERAAKFGMAGAAFGMGFILGPGIGGGLGGVHLRAPFVAAAVLNLVNLIYGLFVLPESLAQEHRRPFTFRRANPLSSLASLGRHPIVFGLTWPLVCGSLAQAILQGVWVLYTQARFGWTTLYVGLSLTAVGFAAAFVQGGLIRVVLTQLGERRTLLFGIVMSIVGYLGFGLAKYGWMMNATIIVFALGGLAGPAVQGLITREVGPSEQGEIQGSLASLSSVTSFIGPLIGGELLARFSTETAIYRLPGAPFFASALLNSVALLLAVRLFARMPETASAFASASAPAEAVSKAAAGGEPAGP
ncbi:MAG TPA: TCR/Tet family MFS transporter [Polyangia bacterium]|nr:TCR/Tet family MFS transporter [Polyangia bacterium]